ncbi:MAG: hypothetical protein JSV63_04075 [Candidatus Aenigmatarchaeota archaeon]|nr:MAG: hypothetical protein JSV63_04075 [Candidatus Aenigmarchaeota archaeon]
MERLAKDSVKASLRETQEIRWAQPIKPGLRFASEPKRFLPFFFTDLATTILVMITVTANLSLIQAVLSEQILPTEMFYSLAAGMILLGVLIVVNLWITGAVIHQSRKPEEFTESWRLSFNKLPTLILALIVVSLITLLFLVIPYIGIFLAAIILLFVNQYIMVDNKGFWESIVSSAKTFRNRIPSVFFAWLFSVVVALVIVGAFSIPMAVHSLYSGVNLSPQDFTVDAQLYQASPALYSIALIIMVLGTSISKTYGLKYLTEIYLQFKRKKWLS